MGLRLGKWVVRYGKRQKKSGETGGEGGKKKKLLGRPLLRKRKGIFHYLPMTIHRSGNSKTSVAHENRATHDIHWPRRLISFQTKSSSTQLESKSTHTETQAVGIWVPEA